MLAIVAYFKVIRKIMTQGLTVFASSPGKLKCYKFRYEDWKCKHQQM